MQIALRRYIHLHFCQLPDIYTLSGARQATSPCRFIHQQIDIAIRRVFASRHSPKDTRIAQAVALGKG